jgi:hypothetical protein
MRAKSLTDPSRTSTPPKSKRAASISTASPRYVVTIRQNQERRA